jgi:hypothetical protein
MEKKIILSFDPVEHKYTDETGKVYTSVTTVLGKYKKPFNKRYWSMYTALKNNGFKVVPTKDCSAIKVNGKTNSINTLFVNPIHKHEAELVLMKWGMLTEAACARGNEIHDFLEDSINLSKGDLQGTSNEVIQPSLSLNNTNLEVEIHTEHDLDKTAIKERFPAIHNRLLQYINLGCVIFAEKKIYSTTYQLAGMIDVMIVNLKTKQFAILDWKTNKDVMMFTSGYFKKKKMPDGTWVKSETFIRTDDKLMYPLDNVDSCKGMIYSLQLSLYAYIMELWGFTLVPQGLEIYHIRPGLQPKLIKVAYMKREIEAMLGHHVTERVIKKTNNNPNLFGIL